MKKLPKSIKVGGHKIKIVYPHTFVDQANYGVYAPDYQTIYLADKGDGSNLELTFWHEVLHAIDEVYNNAGLLEKQVLRLSEGIYQVLKDNKHLRNDCF